jgi:hypothetical protein
MRIGVSRPRINGNVYRGNVYRMSGLGDATGCMPYDIATQLEIIAQGAINNLGFGLEQGTAMSPADVAAELASNAVSLCSKTSFGCAADRCVVPNDLIASLADEYAAAYNSAFQTKMQQIAAGDICVPSLDLFPSIVLSDRARLACGYGGVPAPATVVPQQTAQNQYSYQAPNTLDRVTPQTSLVTTQQSGSALSPPQQPAPVETTQVAGSDVLGTRPGDQPLSVGGFDIPIWALVAGGIGIVILLMSGKGK